MLWWNGRQIANVSLGRDGVTRARLDARKIWQLEEARAASIAQGKRHADRWCAAKLYPEKRLRAASLSKHRPACCRHLSMSNRPCA